MSMQHSKDISTDHVIRFGDARDLQFLESESIDLVVTSPPYPMIEMWDGLFRSMNISIDEAWEREDAALVFELMHRELDRVWTGIYRVLRDDGIVCINVGDAVRSMGGRFSLYPNHARILTACLGLGFHALPLLLWRKPTNAPNKYMGSGMLPVGAYVTLEHEYILILRKGGLRRFDSSGCRRNRSQSALFWEERNRWYSDVWDFRGVRQVLDGNDMRDRSAAFPFELAYRLVNMYSVRGDTVLDPFLGTGTTLVAAVAACRNSIGLEIEQSFQRAIDSRIQSLARDVNGYIAERLRAHERFIDERKDIQFKHQNNRYGFPVMTRQEKELFIPLVNQVDLQSAGRLCVTYAD